MIEVLRNQYSAVVPGYYSNKNHWNTVILGKNVPDEEILKMITLSYDLVAGKNKVGDRRMPKATPEAGLIQAANDNFDKMFKMNLGKVN